VIQTGIIAEAHLGARKTQERPFHTFHQTPCVHDKKTAQEHNKNQEKFEPWIQWLKNKSSFLLQESSPNQKINSLEQHSVRQKLETTVEKIAGAVETCGAG
jgi:hypothetical protein